MFTYGLKDSLALLQSVAQSLGDVVDKLAGGQKAPAAAPASDPPPPAEPPAESPGLDDLRKQVSEFQEHVGGQMEKLDATLEKIAEGITDGRVSTTEPGSPAVDPSKY